MTLSKTRRATRITLSVKPDGRVRLSYPWWVTQRRALDFLTQKQVWVADARRKMAEKYPDLQNDGVWNGAGNGAGAGNGVWNGDGIGGKNGNRIGGENGNDARTRALKISIERLRAEAKELLPPMVSRLAAEHGFRHGQVRIKATRSRWGSCTARGDINLSLSLAALPQHLAEYIVLHELCHTVHRDHSARFHALLDRVTEGRSKALNKELRAYRPEGAIAAAVKPSSD